MKPRPPVTITRRPRRTRGDRVVTAASAGRGLAARLGTRDEAPRRDGRFEQHGARHLRFALAPFDEGDRHFRDPASAPVRHEQHLDEKRVAVGEERVERQRRQRRASPAPVARRAVARAHARHEADVRVREPAEDVPLERPVHDAAARNVARSDHHVGVCGRGQQIRQLRRIVREVGVHLADRDRPARPAPASCRRCTSGRTRGSSSGAGRRRVPGVRAPDRRPRHRCRRASCRRRPAPGRPACFMRPFTSTGRFARSL